MATPILQHLDLGGVSRLQNLPAPAAPTDAARLQDIQSAVEGIAWKDSVRVRAGTNVNLASPGASVDGITMSAGDRFLAAAQTAAAENGIYIWNGAAVAASRSLDANTSDELEGAVVTVEEGTSAGATFRQTAVNFTIGSGSVTWTAFGTAAPSASTTTAGIVELADQTETDAGTDGARAVTPLGLASWPNRMRQFVQNIGDGSATQIDVTHNFNTRDLEVQVWETGGSFRRVDAGLEISLFSVNVVRCNFASAPAAAAYRVVVQAKG